MEEKHISVLLNEVIDALNINPYGIYVDCTLGGGGHSNEILSRLTTGHLYGVDEDPFAICKASLRLKQYMDKFTPIASNFSNCREELNNRDITKVDGILFDLGVSSFQFDKPERGFSYRMDGPLDMRMDTTQSLCAKDVVNTYSEQELRRILLEYGEEKFASKIAHAIVTKRENTEISSTLQLVDIIKSALPSYVLRMPHHPCKKSFQAIRIEVNHELDVLTTALKSLLPLLNPKGRMVVITFHSLEDRIVKNVFSEHTKLNLPKGLPFIPEGYEVHYKLINHHVIIPTEEEIARNPRSHSAKMRVIERID